MSSKSAETLYGEVRKQCRTTSLLTYAMAELEWDERTKMPPAAGEFRTEQVTLLAGMVHRRWTDERFVGQINELAASPLASDKDSPAGATIRRLKRNVDKKIKLPQSLVEALSEAASAGQQVWEKARHNNDFASFQPYLARMFELKRQQAEALGYKTSPYDALLDDYEPEETAANVSRVLTAMREHLVPLVAAIGASKRKPDSSILTRSYPVGLQETFGIQAAAAIGFDFNRGRLDVTVHPFCTTLGPHDCRITTRYDEHFFNMSLFGILHEAGHGMYEQGLPPGEFGLPLGEAISLGIHESQSRMWENLVGRSRAFWDHFYPKAQQTFASLQGVELDDFYFAINESRPSLVRVEADEATYNLHILIRFEMEQLLLNGDLSAADAPAAWNEKYGKYLGITPKTDAEGILQDVHWSAGLIGYFPTYTLGNLYASQFFESASKHLTSPSEGIEDTFRRGEFQPLLEWLRDNIHCHGQRYSAAELVQRVTGRPLTPEPLMAHLKSKYGDLYGIT
jgi:carboxypeptidase Taq